MLGSLRISCSAAGRTSLLRSCLVRYLSLTPFAVIEERTEDLGANRVDVTAGVNTVAFTVMII